MRNPERRFRNEPERLEGGEAPGLQADGEREEAWLPEKNSDRAALAQETRAGGAGLDARAQSAASQAGFGNVGGVRVHTGSAAASVAQSMGARAFAVGQNIFFGSGEYNPGTTAGDELLGQELAHTAQQQGASAPRGSDSIGMTTPGDAVETQADRAGSTFAMAAQGAMVQQASITRGGSMQVARDVRGSRSAADLAAQKEPLLDPTKRAAAVQFNSGRRLPPEVWTQVSGIIGAAPNLAPGEMAEKIARFQATQAFTVDGKLADVTLQRLAQQSGGSGLERHVRNDSIVYLGLNPNSRGIETETLRGAAGAGNVTSITQRGAQDRATFGGRSADLTTPAGLDTMVAAFGRLDTATQGKLRTFIENASEGSRDELAQLASVLYQAELGQRLMKRFVLSGHSGGGSVWGDDNGYLDFAVLADLKSIFPNAMGQVEDLMLSACNTGFNANIPAYLAIFPNVKSVWAYVGYSPSAATGSTRHIKEWEKSTRGAMAHGTVNAGRERVSAGSGIRDDNVAIWTRESGKSPANYETDSPYLTQDYASLRATIDSRLHHYETAMNTGNINQSELDDMYVQLQTLTGSFAGDLGGELARFQMIVKKVLYLRHWRNISTNFMAEHGSKVRAAYGTAAMPPFGSLSRSQTLEKIRTFPGSTSSEGYLLLVSYLRDLDPSKIPDNWV